MGNVKATTASEAAATPFFGVFGSYAPDNDPWAVPAVRDYMHYFYAQTINYLRSRGVGSLLPLPPPPAVPKGAKARCTINIAHTLINLQHESGADLVINYCFLKLSGGSIPSFVGVWSNTSLGKWALGDRLQKGACLRLLEAVETGLGSGGRRGRGSGWVAVRENRRRQQPGRARADVDGLASTNTHMLSPQGPSLNSLSTLLDCLCVYGQNRRISAFTSGRSPYPRSALDVAYACN